MGRPAQDVRFCTSRDGTRIAFAVSGQGAPLLRAGHSFSHLEFEWESEAWRPMLELLGFNRTLVRYDMRGTGLSDRDGIEFSFDRYVEDLEAVVAAAGLRKFSIFGMTGGGALAVAYTVRHPQQISHLVLYGAYLQGRMVRSRTKDQKEETTLVLRLMELGWGQDNPTFQQLFTYQFFPDGSTEQFRSFNELMRRSASSEQAAALLRAWFDADISELAPRLRAPTLVFHARGDLRVPYDQGRLLASCIPGAKLVSLESRNHMLLSGEPAWQHMHEELEAFLPIELAHEAAAAPTSAAGLSLRERSVLDLLTLGLDMPDMASRLGITEKTLRNHLSMIYSKLGVSGRAKATAWAQRELRA